MERRLKEEQVTIAIVEWLKSNGWIIICFDFPQSGTGYILHQNKQDRSSKNSGSFIPDIVAFKNDNVVFFENKDRFLMSDFIKVAFLKTTGIYSSAINNLLSPYSFSKIHYGVGIALSEKSRNKVSENLEKVDFVIFITIDEQIDICFDRNNVFR